MKDFQRTVHIYAERNGCEVQTLDDTGSFNWSGPIPKPTMEHLAAFESSVLDEEKRITGIKTKAGEIILARYPAWKQQNLQARFTELVDKVQGGESLTGQEQQEKDGIKAAWAWAKLVRAESDRLESNPNATPNWPL